MKNGLLKTIVILACLFSFSLNLNEYYLTEFHYVDELESHLEGTLEYQGRFNASDYEGIDFRNTSETSLSPIKKLKIEFLKKVKILLII